MGERKYVSSVPLYAAITERALQGVRDKFHIGDRVKVTVSDCSYVTDGTITTKGTIIRKNTHHCTLKLDNHDYCEAFMWIDMLKAELLK